jgi:hypothetical protein
MDNSGGIESGAPSVRIEQWPGDLLGPKRYAFAFDHGGGSATPPTGEPLRVPEPALDPPGPRTRQDTVSIPAKPGSAS